MTPGTRIFTPAPTRQQNRCSPWKKNSGYASVHATTGTVVNFRVVRRRSVPVGLSSTSVRASLVLPRAAVGELWSSRYKMAAREASRCILIICTRTSGSSSSSSLTSRLRYVGADPSTALNISRATLNVTLSGDRS